MIITSQFDSGNIRVIQATDPQNIKLAINPDNGSEFYQWFHFKLQSTKFVEHKLVITDLEKSAYPDGWPGYQAVASYDREEWFRVETSFHDNNLTIDFVPEYDSVYFAYFTPYSYERHQDFISAAQMSFDCELRHIGFTLDKRDMSLLVIGEEAEGKNKIWVTARQHPGESMAEWLVEGLVRRLLDEDDGVAKKLLEDNVFYVIPNMNPDGSARGHLRTNAVGTNLNREWKNPSEDKSPEVLYTLQAMDKYGVDMFLDIHGDEALPYNFVAGCEGNPNYNARLEALETRFKEALLLATPEFQDVFGYAKDAPGTGNTAIAANAVGHRFDCLSYTVEMPFKDNDNLPDPAYGWSAPRCQQFGEDLLIAIRAVSASLR
ncbi:M14 family metallopeptidase [Brumicola nitratireducens]|uniref:Putative carboxypeptidase, Zn dependent n=1 Tax=Glaciecola nitratireducens (strain JCM 12485 / KCTC 12276 / FR1064) TaxID=1085623 RepID=G4QH16_GLANF|nr:M14-type cytosolic carboxypeptidase [Glaciecola nitratireducens]AEP30204.1 putative carboxypeptidase, Zn dependent [Glaciecola nitratireducens FR1064]